MSRARGGHAAGAARWVPVAAACLLALLSACADQWLDPAPVAAGPDRCPAGSFLDTRAGLCIEAGCAADDDCRTPYICDLVAGACVLPDPPGTPGEPRRCNEGAVRCGFTGERERCSDDRWVAWSCPGASRCGGAGTCETCARGARRCLDDGSAAYEICAGVGEGWREVACPEGAWCAEGRCRSCEPGAVRCSSSGREICDSTGTRWDSAPCGAGTHCSAEVLACVPNVCLPNQASCHPDDPGMRLVCAPDGSEIRASPCDPGSSCHEPTGLCLDACARAAIEGQGAGCDYWFTHLPSGGTLRNVTSSLRLRVSNPGTSPTSVRVSAADGTTLVPDSLVQPGKLLDLPLPWHALSGTALAPAAFRLESTEPVLAHTFSHAEGLDVTRCILEYQCAAPPCPDAACAVPTQSGGATLLLPTHLLGSGADGRYLAYSPRHRHEILPAPALLAIVGTRDDTALAIDFTGTTEVSADGGVAAYPAGTRGRFVLRRGEVLQLATARTGPETTFYVDDLPRSESANDFTGTQIVSNAPVAVFAGADAARVPLDSPGLDHLEEQLPPISLWGRHYVGTPRSPADRFTLIVARNDTIVAFSSPVTLDGGRLVSVESALPAGKVLSFRATADFQVQASAPVLLVQTTSVAPDGAGPSLLVAAPVERYRSRYDVRVPQTAGQGSPAELVLVGPQEAADGQPPNTSVGGKRVTSWSTLPGTALRVARVPLCATSGPCEPEGVYTIESSEPVGLTVYERGGGTGAAWVGGLGGDFGGIRPPSY